MNVNSPENRKLSPLLENKKSYSPVKISFNLDENQLLLKKEMSHGVTPGLYLNKNSSSKEYILDNIVNLDENIDTEKEEKELKSLNETFLSNYNDTTNNSKSEKSNKDLRKGHLFNLISILGFFISNIFTKIQYLYIPNISIELSQLYRSIIITLLSIIHILSECKNLNFQENLNNKMILFLNSFFGNIIYIFYFLACFYLRLGTANTLLYSYPLFSFIFAYMILKEKIKALDVVGLFVGTISILLVIHFGQIEQPFDDDDKDDGLLDSKSANLTTTLLGIFFGIMGAISISAKSVICKQSTKVNINLHFLLFWMGLFGIIIGLGAIIIRDSSFDLNFNIIWINLLLGISTYYANVFLLESFKYITLVESLIPGFITIILAFFVGKFTFNNSLDFLDITGSLLLIVFSYFYIRHKVHHRDSSSH